MIGDMTSTLDPDVLWQAVRMRDAGFDGRFIFGVRSTGIYCRPGCPARTPRRRQVIFFATTSEAQAAGFRACRRCRPDDALPPNQQLVQAACQVIEAAPQRLSLAELGRQVGVSPYHLQRVFKAVLGCSPREYAEQIRQRRFKDGLHAGLDVAAAAYQAGYASTSQVYENARFNLGMTPGAYRQGGKGMHIDYTISPCPLGYLLLAASPEGVCALTFNDDKAALESFVRAEFPAAELRPNPQRLQAWVESILAYLDGRSAELDIPVSAAGTAFQQTVWAELRRIPYGQTRTYAQIAQAIHRPRAVRAVARACASNPVSLLTPCHRVIRSDGALAGYRWGLARKEQLLRLEQTSTQ